MFQKTSPRVQQNIKQKIKFDIKIILLQIDPNHLKTYGNSVLKAS